MLLCIVLCIYEFICYYTERKLGQFDSFDDHVRKIPILSSQIDSLTHKWVIETLIAKFILNAILFLLFKY